MKKLLTITLLVFTSSLLKAQPSFSISGGIKMINAEPQTTTLWYVDESPSRDNIFKNIDPIGNMAINLSARWQDNSTGTELRPFLEGQGYLGSINGLAINGGFMYSKASQNKVKIQPEISAILGYCSKGVGVIENNDVYIQVNHTMFQDYSDVFVSIRNAYIGIKPGLSFAFKTSDYTEIGIGVNYQLSFKAGFVAFRGPDQNGIIVTDFENLTENNVSFYVNGNESETNPYNPDGLEFKVFYSF